MQKLYGPGGFPGAGSAAPGGFPDAGGEDGPSVKEVGFLAFLLTNALLNIQAWHDSSVSLLCTILGCLLW